LFIVWGQPNVLTRAVTLGRALLVRPLMGAHGRLILLVLVLGCGNRPEQPQGSDGGNADEGGVGETTGVAAAAGVLELLVGQELLGQAVALGRVRGDKLVRAPSNPDVSVLGHGRCGAYVAGAAVAVAFAVAARHGVAGGGSSGGCSSKAAASAGLVHGRKLLLGGCGCTTRGCRLCGQLVTRTDDVVGKISQHLGGGLVR